MSDIRIKGLAAGTDLGTFAVTIDGETQSTLIDSLFVPAVISGLPRCNAAQSADDVLSVDTTGLTGISGYVWRIRGGAVIGTTATVSGTGLAGSYVECAVTCDQGTLNSPPVMVYMTMPMASHNAVDAAVLDLVPHTDATHLAVADGLWTDPATWYDGMVPNNGARVLIPFGITVTYDQAAYYRLDWIRNDGSLIVSRTQSTFALFETFVNTRGAVFECGSQDNPLPAQHRSEWVISNRTCRTQNLMPTDIDITRDPKLLGRGIINQGTRVMWGAEKTSWLRTSTAMAPKAGASQAELASAPSGWAVGDLIAIGGTGNTELVETELREITAIDGAVVTWAIGLSYDHDHRNANVTRTDLQPGIANLTRNIVIRSESSETVAHQRGHTMDMHMHCHQDLWNVEHYDLGRTIKRYDTPSGKIIDGAFNYIEFDADDGEATPFQSEAPTAQSNIQSRYPIHLHFGGFDRAKRNTVHGCTVRNSVGWGITHHGCEAFMNNNAIVHFEGAGMVSETGNETGEWLDNFSAGALTKVFLTPKNRHFPRGLKGDFFFDGYAFAMRSRALRCNANLAMDTSWGFTFYHRSSHNSMTPPIDHVTAHLDLKDLQGFYNSGHMPIADYPIIHFNDNESAGARGGGFFVTKPFGEQDHGVGVNIKRFKSWGFGDAGFLVEYIGQYALTDLDIVAPSTGGLRYGINVFANNAQVAVVRAKTEGCHIGINIDGTDTVRPDTLFDPVNEPRYMIVAHVTLSDTTALVDASSPGMTRIYATEPAYVEPTHTVPFKIGDWDGSTGYQLGFSNAVRDSLLMDSVGQAGGLPKPADNMAFPVDAPNSNIQGQLMRQFVLNKGYWMIDGAPFAVFPKYYADRLTGVPIKSFHGIALTGNLSGMINNGDYTIGSAPPQVAPAALTVSQGSVGTIDILSLASGTGGGAITLSDSYMAPDHGRISLTGGQVTYEPDPAFTGTDIARLWVENGQGHATRVDLNITVS